MDWFFVINESSAAFHIYAPLAKMAVHTARTQTSLRERGVDVIFAESYLKSEVWRLSKSAPSFLPGVFLRLELPRLGSSLNARNPLLYTDCDAMFRRDVAMELKAAICTYFAVASESKLDDYRDINTGVMLMNLDKLREVDVDFRALSETTSKSSSIRDGIRAPSDASLEGNERLYYGIDCFRP